MGKDKTDWKSENRWRTGQLNSKERDAMERYGLDPSNYGWDKSDNPGQHSGGNYDDMREDFLRAASNDYDTRRGIEALAMSGKGKAEKIAKGGFKNTGDVMNANNIQRKQHERMGNGGSFSSLSDFAGVSYGSVERDREKHNEDIDSRISAMSVGAQQEEAQDNGFTVDGDDTEVSEEMQAAKDRAKAWEDSQGMTTGDFSPYGPSDSAFSDAATAVYGGDDQQADTTVVADSLDAKAAGGYLNAFKEKMKQERNFKRDF